MAARRRRDNAIIAVLAVLAVLGGGRTIIGWFTPPPPKPSDKTTVSIVGHAQLAESFAEEFVVTYLGATGGQQDRLKEFVDLGQQVHLPTTARQVSEPIVVHATRDVGNAQLEVWSVTVSVRPKASGGAAGPREYYRVAVSVAADGRMRALALPAAVAPPGRGEDLMLRYTSTCGADTPVAQVASGFLAAFLTGNGDVTRYVAQNSGIAALQPAPFTSVETPSVGAEDADCGISKSTAKVLATVNPKTGAGAAPTLAYPLTMVRTAGQWQVQAMDSVPALKNPLTVVAGGGNTAGAPAGATSTSPSTAVSIPPATQN
ncbi:conjugal transfer protein [Nocardia wallacei]|uniref:conjugal transfer protein n=1 Tax=Nocardia wallacei TaxID=480035 RepID=UPI0024589799|nr:conjugal transfer protein [Nocardia wallacei]